LLGLWPISNIVGLGKLTGLLPQKLTVDCYFWQLDYFTLLGFAEGLARTKNVQVWLA
jgi:hypothetical protein